MHNIFTLELCYCGLNQAIEMYTKGAWLPHILIYHDNNTVAGIGKLPEKLLLKGQNNESIVTTAMEAIYLQH